ncbi:MAG: hypothetical protein ACPGVS_11160, partial [Primorskyibacter sp.]
DVLDRSLHAARVRAVEGRVIALDMPVALDSATEYGLRYRVFEDDDDAVGTSVVVGLRPVAGETGLLSLRGQTQMPDPGALVQIGPLGQEALAMRVVSVEPGQAFAAHLTLVPAAPEIDTLTDAEVPPVWTGRVGDDITLAAVAPAVPVFVSVASDAAWLGATPQAAPIEVVVTDGAGSSATAQQFRIDHRAAGDTVWLSETAPAADGGLSLLGYVTDTDVELRAVALAEDGTASAPTESVTHTVGGASADRPDALDDAAVGVTGGMGHARITVAVNDDNATTHLVLYRVPQGDTLDPDAHAFGAAVAVTRGTTAVMIDGDATRSNLLGNPDFADVSVWSAGT